MGRLKIDHNAIRHSNNFYSSVFYSSQMASISHQHPQQTAESSGHSAEEIEEARKILYDVGIQNRYAVVGKAHVDRSLEAGSDFSRPMQVCTLQTGRRLFPLHMAGICDTGLLGKHMVATRFGKKTKEFAEYRHALCVEQEHGAWRARQRRNQ